jgi:hypothetical protein
MEEFVLKKPIGTVFIPVGNIDKARDWYCDRGNSIWSSLRYSYGRYRDCARQQVIFRG